MMRRWRHRRALRLWRRLYRETRHLEAYKLMLDWPTYIRAVHRVMRARLYGRA